LVFMQYIFDARRELEVPEMLRRYPVIRVKAITFRTNQEHGPISLAQI
jgi:hypothetical protein